MTLRHFIDTQDYTKQDLLDIIALARRIKAADQQGCDHRNAEQPGAERVHLRHDDAEAEAEQLCPESPEGLARKQCLERRMHQLPASCQLQLRERLVKWKEERSRLTAACEVEMNRFCSAVTPGGRQVLQCLQEHAQELSDRCYETLPKGTVYFKQ